MRLFRAALAALLALLLASPALADERILSFTSDVQVRDDSSLDVTETTDVRAENLNINHGIFRVFPTRYKEPRARADVDLLTFFEPAAAVDIAGR